MDGVARKAIRAEGTLWHEGKAIHPQGANRISTGLAGLLSLPAKLIVHQAPALLTHGRAGNPCLGTAAIVEI